MEQKVSFYSDGLKIAGILFEPEDAGDESCPAILMCQGMIGIKEYFRFSEMARQFVSLGCVAMTWDYRGCGESEGEKGRLYPWETVEDIRNALTFLELQPKIDPKRLAIIGWAYGGGIVPCAAAVDERVKCAISVGGWGDGELRMRSQRSNQEWHDFLDRMAVDRRSRVLTGKSELLGARFYSDQPSTASDSVASKIPEMQENRVKPSFSMATAEKVVEFKPIDLVDRISPRAILYVAIEEDKVTPARDIENIYNRTREPKKLEIIQDIPHYSVYEEPALSRVVGMTADLMKEHRLLR